MLHFQDCIGAIDGVHVRASIRSADQIPYIGRKGMPTQNIMAACNFDMQFIFACAGWEGTAHDTRIFLSAIRNPELNFPKPPNGNIYFFNTFLLFIHFQNLLHYHFLTYSNIFYIL